MHSIGITSFSGKMGKVLVNELSKSKSCILKYAYTRNIPETKSEIPLTSDLEELVKTSDVIIDFSSPELLSPLLDVLKKYRKPLVCGTTGLSEEHFAKLKSSAAEFPIFYAPNMGIGVNVLAQMLHRAKDDLISNFDIKIIDTHHKHKKDAPSGTALFLANQLQTQDTQIPITSIREGEAFGTHEVILSTPDETITITHQALNRNVFAMGAIKAAMWLASQKNGLYSFQDLLKTTA